MPLEPWVVLAALAIEAACGYPDRIQRIAPHPVRGIGWALEALEIRWNNPARSDIRRRMLGVLTLLMVTGATVACGGFIQWVCAGTVLGPIVIAVCATPGLAQRSLHEHVGDVRRELHAGDIAAARNAVSKIVGRDTARLDESGIAKAAIESLAESFNDAVVAPAFWLFVAGLPGLFAYKTVNTADSIIGHFEPRWRAFGWAAARADDLVNLIPARLAGLLITLAGAGGLRTMLRDAMKHASPNAGWTEAAMAGALAVQLGGPTTYDGQVHRRPQFGDGRTPVADDLNRAMRLYVRACIALWIAFALLEALWLH